MKTCEDFERPMTTEQDKALVEKLKIHREWAHPKEESCSICFRYVAAISADRIKVLEEALRHTLDCNGMKSTSPAGIYLGPCQECVKSKALLAQGGEGG